MNDVNWWLMALAFLLGLLLTFAFMIRRVKREVPIYAALGRGPGVGASGLKGPDVDVKAPNVDVKAPHLDVKAPDVDLKAPDVDLKGAGLAAGAAAVGGAAAAKLVGGKDVKASDVDVKAPDVDIKKPGVDLKGAGLAAGAAAVGGAAAAKLVGGKDDEEPYGSGSLRLAGGAVVPSGYTIKGNEDSMLYHSPDSPFYKETVPEVWFRDTDSAERAGFTRWDLVGGAGAAAGAATAKFAAVADVPPGPHGAGSAKAGAGGSGPEGWTIKGNEDSMLYHTTDSPSYKRTIAEVWFREESVAEKAGFTRWDKGRSGGVAKFAAVADVPPGPHGPGSATPGAGGSGPTGWTIKGNADSMLFHTPASPAYAATIAEVWFVDEASAEAAGFKKYK